MKYRLTDEKKEWCGHILHRIEAVKDFADVKAGEKGGWIEQEENLSQEDNCWVYDNARVCGDAQVCGDAWVYDNAQVFDNAQVCGNAWVCDDAEIKTPDDLIYIIGIGSCNRTTTVFRTKENGLRVSCGCFCGDLNEFAAKVKETHGDSKYAWEYMSFIETVKIHFKVKE